MIKPLSRSRTVKTDEPLPPCWLRCHPTRPLAGLQPGGRLLHAGPDGVLLNAIVATLDGAREVALVASFLLSDAGIADAMLRATGRGVRVYVLAGSEARLGTVLRDDDEFGAARLEEHKRLLDRLAGEVLLRSAGHFHAKFVIADPWKDANGWLSTANLNPALTESVELGLSVRGAEACAMAEWFAWVFWCEAERELAGKGRLAAVGAPPTTPKRPKSNTVVATARETKELGEAVLAMIRGARRELLLCSYGLGADHAVVVAAVERAKAGVPVTLLTRPRPAIAEAVSVLSAAGARVFAHDKLHAKAVVADGSAMVLTANLQAEGLDRGFELGVRLHGDDARLLGATLRGWAEVFPWRYAAGKPRSVHLGEICLAEAGLRDGIREVVEERQVQLSPVVADSALRLDAAPEPAFQAPAGGRSLPQRVRYNWQVVPPTLPRGARERFREVEVRGDGKKSGKAKTERVAYSPRVFGGRGGPFVLLEEGGRPNLAEELARELNARVVLPAVVESR